MRRKLSPPWMIRRTIPEIEARLGGRASARETCGVFRRYQRERRAGGRRAGERSGGVFEVVGQRRKERSAWWATAISVVVHAALVLLLVFGFRQSLLMAGEGDD